MKSAIQTLVMLVFAIGCATQGKSEERPKPPVNGWATNRIEERTDLIFSCPWRRSGFHVFLHALEPGTPENVSFFEPVSSGSLCCQAWRAKSSVWTYIVTAG